MCSINLDIGSFIGDCSFTKRMMFVGKEIWLQIAQDLIFLYVMSCCMDEVPLD